MSEMRSATEHNRNAEPTIHDKVQTAMHVVSCFCQPKTPLNPKEEECYSSALDLLNSNLKG